MRRLGVVMLAGLMALVAGAANAQPGGRINCVLYRGYNGQVFVQGSLCRTANPNVWVEVNSQNAGIAQFQVVAEPQGAVVLRKADGLQVLVNVDSAFAAPDTLDYRATPQPPWVRLYSITGAERR